MLEADWYDYPQYYDLLFRSETPLEADFLEAAGRQYCPFPVRTLFEPAWGPGGWWPNWPSRVPGQRLGLERAGAGLSASASGPAAAVGHGLPSRHGGLCFASTGRCGVLPGDSFRHLLSEQAARRHLECVARDLRPGGVYVLGFHLLPPDADEECIERWAAARGTRVSGTLRVLACSRRRRSSGSASACWSAPAAASCGCGANSTCGFTRPPFAAAPQRPALELCGVYDFWYDIDQPLKLTERTGRCRVRVAAGSGLGDTGTKVPDSVGAQQCIVPVVHGRSFSSRTASTNSSGPWRKTSQTGRPNSARTAVSLPLGLLRRQQPAVHGDADHAAGMAGVGQASFNSLILASGGSWT